MADASAGSAGGLLGTLYIRFTAQTDDLNKKVDESEKKVTKGAKNMEKAAESLTHVLKALGLAWGIHEIVDFVKETIHGADELKKFSQEIGITIDRLAGLKFAADKAGVGDQFQMGMRKFAESLREAQVEGSAMQAVFRELKVDASQGPDKAFEQTTEQLGKMADGVNKLGVVQEVFGTRNARFVNLVSGGVAGLNRDIEELARVTGMSYEEAAKKSEEYNDAVTTLKYALQGLVLVFANEALPIITEFVTNIANNTKELQAQARQMAVFVSVLVKGLLLAFNSLKAGFNIILSGMASLLEGLMRIGRWVAEKLTVAFEFWANAAIKSINMVIKGLNMIKPGDAIKEIAEFTVGKPTGLDTAIDFVHEVNADLAQQFDDTSAKIKDGLGEMIQTVSDGYSGVAKAAKEGKEEIKKQGGLGFNPQELKDFNDRLAKQIGSSGPGGAADFQKMRGGLRSEIGDISGIQGDSFGSFKNQAELEEVDQHLKDIQKLRDSHFDITKEQNERLTEMERLYAQKRQAIQLSEVKMRLSVASDMFGDLASITKAWAGEQSGIYKAMFAVSKAFAIAEATVKIAQGIAAAAANPWPLNLFAMASVIAATASIVSSIQAVQLEFGGERAMGGNVDTGKAFLVGEKGPEMFVPNRNGTIVPNNRLGGGMSPKVIVNNFSDARHEVETRNEGGEPVIEILARKVEDRLGSNVRSGTGNLNKAMQDSFNLRRGQGNQ